MAKGSPTRSMPYAPCCVVYRVAESHPAYSIGAHRDFSSRRDTKPCTKGLRRLTLFKSLCSHIQQRPRNNKRKWWIIGGIIALIVILGAVLGGVFGSRAANDDDNSSSSGSSQSDNQGGSNNAANGGSVNNGPSATRGSANEAVKPTVS